jgi:hypothetical protein
MAETFAFKPLIYLGFRLAPFILVTYFVLSSLFSADISGIIFLGFLLINCIITISLGSLLGTPAEYSNNALCHVMNLTTTGPISKVLPLNVNVFSFTFAYLLYIIIKYKLVSQHIATLIFFPILIVYQLWWSHVNGCSHITYSALSGLIGAILGVLFSATIDASGLTKMQNFNGLNNKDICTRPQKTYFKCST